VGRTSESIAGIVGPTLVVLVPAEWWNLDIWRESIPQLTFLNGMFLFVAGLGIVRAHNRWERSWRTLVTLVGWMALFAGTYRMVAPRAPQLHEGLGTDVFLGLLLAVGLVLSFMAYRPRAEAH